MRANERYNDHASLAPDELARGQRETRFGRRAAGEVSAPAAAPPREIVEEAYLLAYCRPPSEEERTRAERLLESASSLRVGVEDLFWALMNTPEFLFVD